MASGNFFGSTLVRAAEVRITFSSDAKVSVVGMLQNVTINLDAGIRPFFELGSEIKFFIPDRPRAALRADKLFCIQSNDVDGKVPNFIGSNVDSMPGIDIASLLSEKGFGLTFSNVNTNLPNDMVFLLESYSFVANVGNLVVMENITATGEVNPIATNYETAASSITG